VILIVLGVLFLVSNVRPDLSIVSILGRFWPFLLIGWGLLRLLELVVWAVRRRPLPTTGISGGEWMFVILISMAGSASFFFSHRAGWPPINFRMRGLEMLGEPFDYPIAEQTVRTAAGKPVRVVIEHIRGNARITGSDKNEVRVSGRKTVRAMSKQDAERAADGLAIELVQDGETVFVRVKGSRANSDDFFVSSDLEISVPANARIDAHGRRGDFDVNDVQGDVDVDSDNAGVRLENVGGNVRIDVRASDIIRAARIGGGVDLKGSGHDVELESVAGQVVVGGAYSGDLQFRAIAKPVRFEGGIKSRGPAEWRVESCPGQIRMSRGNLSLENVAGPVVVNAKSKDVQVAGFTQGLDLHVDRGDLEIRADVLPVPRMTVSTNSGDVELTLPENGKFSLRASVDKGQLENQFGEILHVQEQGRGGTITGDVGNGAEVNLRANRGSLRVRKGSPAESALPAPPKPPVKPVSPSAARSLVIQHN